MRNLVALTLQKIHLPMIRKTFTLAIHSLKDPIKLTVSLAVILMMLVITASWHYYLTLPGDFMIQLLAELHGLVLDIFVIGILIVWINRLSEKRRAIEFCKQQIDDLRSLRGDHVRLKIMSCIKILNRYKIFEIDLNGVSVSNAPLNNINLTGSDLNGFECRKAKLIDATLTRCNMNGSIFDKADLFQADLSYVSGNGARFNNANLSKAKLCHSKFITTSFRNCYLNGASLAGSNLLSADFEGAHLLEVDFRGCKELRPEQLLKAKILYNCIFDPSLVREFEELNSGLETGTSGQP